MTPAFEHIQVRESFFDRALNHLSKPQYSHESDTGCATHGEWNRRYVGNVIENAPEEMLVHGSKDFLALAKYKKSTCTVGQKRHALAELSNKHDGIGIHFILSTDLSQ